MLMASGEAPVAVRWTTPQVMLSDSCGAPDHVIAARTGPPPATVHSADAVPGAKFSGPGFGPGTLDAVTLLEPAPAVPPPTGVGPTEVDVTGAVVPVVPVVPAELDAEPAFPDGADPPDAPGAPDPPDPAPRVAPPAPGAPGPVPAAPLVGPFAACWPPVVVRAVVALPDVLGG